MGADTSGATRYTFVPNTTSRNVLQIKDQVLDRKVKMPIIVTTNTGRRFTVSHCEVFELADGEYSVDKDRLTR